MPYILVLANNVLTVTQNFCRIYGYLARNQCTVMIRLSRHVCSRRIFPDYPVFRITELPISTDVENRFPHFLSGLVRFLDYRSPD